ncbi:MAG: hypothetical protein ABSC01_02260 [Verrucomicrobiota bacterium]|jgi:hypothetical protein
MKTKILWRSVVSVLAAGIVAGVGWWMLRPQTVALSDGTRLTLLKVTYGQRHKAPGSPSGTSQRGGTFQGTNDFLVVWIRQEHKGAQWPNYQLYAYDKAGSACVGFSGMTYANNNRQQGREIVGVRFDAFPRRDGKIILRLQEWNPQGGQQTVRDAFVISNPARGPFPTWLPDSLPNTQSDGDLDVTLNKLVLGVKTPWQRNNSAADAMNRGVQVAFDVQQSGHAATNWQPVQIETSDATGNRVSGSVNTVLQDGEPMTFYQWGLWPDEPAWKLRVEFSRTSGFNDDELWTVQDIPVESGKMQDFWSNNPRNRKNPGFAETTLNGIHLKIFPVKQFTDQPPESAQQGAFQVQLDPVPEGLRMTVVKATDDQGRIVRSWRWSWGGNFNAFALRELEGVKSINVTLALHKSRFVEFTVKPTKP